MRTLLLLIITMYGLWAYSADTDFTEKFEKQSIYGRWIDIDSGSIVEIDSRSDVAFERLDNNLIIVKSGRSKTYLKRIGALHTKIEGQIVGLDATGELSPLQNASVTLSNKNDPTIRAQVLTNAKGYFFDETLPSGSYILEATHANETLKITVELAETTQSLGMFVLRSGKSAVFKSQLFIEGDEIITDGQKHTAKIGITNYGKSDGKVCYDATVKDGSARFGVIKAACITLKAGASTYVPITLGFDPIKINSEAKELTVALRDDTGLKIVEYHPFTVYKDYFTLTIDTANKEIKAYVLMPAEQLKPIDIKKGRISLPRLSDESYRLIIANSNPKIKTAYEVDIGAEQKLTVGKSTKEISTEERAKASGIKAINPFKLRQSIGRYPDVGDITIYTFSIADTIRLQEDDAPARVRFSMKNDLGERINYVASITNPKLATVNYEGEYLTITPQKEQNGVATITLATSGKGAIRKHTKYFTLYLDAVNDLPTITSAPKSSVLENSPYSYYLKAFDLESKQLVKKVLLAPKWLSFNPASGLLSGTPKDADVGNHAVVLSVSDGTDSVKQSFEIDVVALARAPKAQGGSFVVDEDSTLSQKLTAQAKEDETLSFSVSKAPLHGKLVLAPTGSFTYTPKANFYGEDGFAFVVKSSNGKSTSANATITVKPRNDAPTATSIVLDEVGSGPAKIEWIKASQADDIDGDVMRLEVLDTPKLGTLTLEDETLVYMPFAETQGSEVLKARILDEEGASVAITLTLNGIMRQLTPRVLQTGQGNIFHALDDAEYKRSMPRLYAQDFNESIGIITKDMNSQLVWHTPKKAQKLPYEEAKRLCQELEVGPITSWRLPTIEELVFVAHKGELSPAIDKAFVGIQNDYYWSSSTYPTRSASQWVLYFADGSDYYRSIHKESYVTCVHEGIDDWVVPFVVEVESVSVEDNSTLDLNSSSDANLTYEANVTYDANATTDVTLEVNSILEINATVEANMTAEANVTLPPPPPRFEHNATLGVTLDNSLELMWYDAKALEARTWVAAIDVCDGMVHAEFGDWRLPNFNELYSMAQHEANATVVPEPFTLRDGLDYWTSTTFAGDIDRAWGISFDKGSDFTYDKTERHFVRCVRDLK
ncbi:MAG: hypothetical protein KU37_03595 [Sulfuricurvum sp. PC08-66]|nr:MAG: hypothetical protein KU37_03595 [Sulfuricurvum sp. PC08-66]